MVVAIAGVWLVFGVVAAWAMHRRGHDTFMWALLFLVLGPLALPLAISTERHPPPLPPAPVHEGDFDVLVAHDGSDDAAAALAAALELLAGRLTSLTLAVVLDIEAANTARGRDTVEEAERHLDRLATELARTTTAPVDTVVLHGEPARALEAFAADHGYELIVAGSRGRRAAHLARGSVARALATRSAVPVLIGPVTR